MKISFDLDGTLIPFSDEFETEKLGFFGKLIGVEKIRKNTPELFLYLKERGHSINIYTTSFRKKNKIRRTLRYYKLSADRIVNQFENRRTLEKIQISSSKYPKAFGFDIHIDDSEGVQLEGEKFLFDTIILDPKDSAWIDTIKARVL